MPALKRMYMWYVDELEVKEVHRSTHQTVVLIIFVIRIFYLGLKCLNFKETSDQTKSIGYARLRCWM